VKMDLNDATWHIVKDTPKITGFVGGSMAPPVVPDEEVMRIIDGLTKIEGISESSVSSQSETLKKILLTLSDDVRVILIKLADRLHNMRTLDSMKREQQVKVASETKYLYAPLAYGLGLYLIKSELEDLSFKYTQPQVYREITEKLGVKSAERQAFFAAIANDARSFRLLAWTGHCS